MAIHSLIFSAPIKKAVACDGFFIVQLVQISDPTMQLPQQRFAYGFFLSQLLQRSLVLLDLRWLFLLLELQALQVCGFLRHNQPTT
jgi:hypothetical protein